MDYSDIKELIEIISNSEFTEFELSIDNVSIKLNKNKCDFNERLDKPIKENSFLINKPKENIFKKQEKEEKELKGNEIEGKIVKSPIVGTFYSSQGPEKPSFIKIGDKVKHGDILCIVEAMKIMNEITSIYEGEVAEIFVENEQLVEFGQPLFRIV